jgi:excisionase family DNA binding protein
VRVSPAKPSKHRAVASATPSPTVPRITYRRDEAAQALGVSVQTVDSWIAAGVLRASKPPGVAGTPGRYLLIRATDIAAMLDASAVAVAA